MFEKMSEQQAREAILEQVREYAERFHGAKPWRTGQRIGYAGRVYGAPEMENLVDASLEFWLTSGRYTDEFERGLAEYVGVSSASFVNSGSSANLLAFQAICQPELGERAVGRGDEVITVAAGFPTTIAPILQAGAVPLFVDVELPQCNISVEAVRAAITPKTKAVMAAHTLGNPFDLQALRELCDEHGLWLVEDNCDALGSLAPFDGALVRTGSVGDLATCSFYPPHHMTCGEGGAVLTSSPKLARIVRSLRDWGRDCSCPSGKDDCCGHRFDGQFGLLPKGYDHKYVYSRFGYNLKATDLQAAVGCAQLKRLPQFVDARRSNWDYLRQALQPLADAGKLVLPEPLPGSEPSWFGFLMLAGKGVDAVEAVRSVEEQGVQTRRLFAGNILLHPCFDAIRGTDAYRVSGTLENTDRVMADAFWVGVYPGMDEAKLAYMAEAITKAVG